MEVLSSIWDYFVENHPMLGVGLAIVIVTVIVTWRVGKFYAKCHTSFKVLETLPCGNHNTIINDTSNKFDSINDQYKNLNSTMTEMSKWIMKKDRAMIDKLAIKNSPFKMTPLGEELFIFTPAKKIMDENIELLIKEMEEINPLIAPDVEDQALNVLIAKMGTSFFAPIKEFLYYQPEKVSIKDPATLKMEDVELSMFSLIRLMSIYLRDKYLEKYPNIR